MAVSITAPVGKGVKNTILGDNMAVQMLLNKFIMPGCLGTLQVLLVDGLVGAKTIVAIQTFQSGILGHKNPDGRVDPNGQTLAGLNGPLKWANGPPKTPADVASRDWGIRLLPGPSERQWQFELRNVDCDTAHRLDFVVAAGMYCPSALTVSAMSLWTSCGKYRKVEVSQPTRFGDFHGKHAVIAPIEQATGHRLYVGHKQPLLAAGGQSLLESYTGTVARITLPLPGMTVRNRLDPRNQGKCGPLANFIVLVGQCVVHLGSGTPSRPLVWYV
mgnify:CR=1 FL=1